MIGGYMTTSKYQALEPLISTDKQIRITLHFCKESLVKLGEDPKTIKRRVAVWRTMIFRLKESCEAKILTQKLIDNYISKLNLYINYKPNYNFSVQSIVMLKEIFFSQNGLSDDTKCHLDIPLSNHSAFYEHLCWLKTFKNLSSVSLKHKKTYLRKLEQYLKAHDIDYEDINTNVIRDFYKTINATIPLIYNLNHDLNILFKWMFKQGIVSKDLRPFVGKVKYKRTSIPEPFIYEDLIKLWNYSSNDYSYVGMRTKAVLGILISTGLRISDIANLKKSNLNWGQKKVVISLRTHKTHQNICFEINTAAANAIYRYINLNSYNKDCEYIFQRKNGSKMTGNSLSHHIRKLINQCDLTSEHSTNGPHRIRASIATLAANNNEPDYVISSILTHSSSASLTSYVSFNLKQLRKCTLEIEPITCGLYLDLKVKKGDKNG